MNSAKVAIEEKSTSIFPTTHWTTLLRPIQSRSKESGIALERLFAIYRKPIVDYIRILVGDSEQAEDIAHDFVARLLARGDLAHADRSKGRFRSYLAMSIRHFVVCHHRAKTADMRKALNDAIPIDGIEVETGPQDNAERQFTRRWWRATLDEALRRLRAEWVAVGKAALFDDLEPLLWEKDYGRSIPAIAAKHHMAPNAISVRKTRMLARFREILCSLIGETVGSPAEVREEVRLFLQDS